MSQETLSALLDGECSQAELDSILADFESSPESRRSWSRMCVVRDSLAGSRVAAVDDSFCAGVMAAIAAEPAAAVEPVAHPKVVQLPVRRVVRSRWQQPLVGLAAAASIAGAVVIGGNSLLSRPLGGAPAAAVASAGSSALTPVSALAANVASAEPQETRWGQLDADSARQLNDYMMEHSNYRAEQGMGGSLSYARMAVRTADYRPAAEQH